MAAGRERGKLAAGPSDQFIGIDPLGLVADALDQHLLRVGRMAGCAHSSYPKSAPSFARMNGAPTSTQESSGGSRSDTARTMNTSGSETPFGLIA